MSEENLGPFPIRAVINTSLTYEVVSDGYIANTIHDVDVQHADEIPDDDVRMVLIQVLRQWADRLEEEGKDEG